MPAIPQPPLSHPVVLFDGVCNLCNHSVQFIIRRDSRRRFRFAPLQSSAAKTLLGSSLPSGSTPVPDSIVLIEPGMADGPPRISTHSTAALRIARQLRPPWPLLSILMVIPRPVRDAAYGFIAKRRYRWFGKRESCIMPSPELSDRFLA